MEQAWKEDGVIHSLTCGQIPVAIHSSQQCAGMGDVRECTLTQSYTLRLRWSYLSAVGSNTTHPSVCSGAECGLSRICSRQADLVWRVVAG